jgi:HPt (histidine-containing phosphotransfer) domain-containing protein
MTVQIGTEEEVCVFDANQLAMIESLMGPQKLQQAIEKFKQDLDVRVSAIAEKRTEPSDKSTHAHKLIGTAGILGLLELSEACKRLELAAGQHADLEPHIAYLLAVAARARSKIEKISVAA